MNRCKQNPQRKQPSKAWLKAMAARRGEGINQYKTNPNWKFSEDAIRKIREANLKRTHSPAARKKISEALKLAHAEGRAWNIGMSRWNNEPSYPERFFAKVIQNEFADKAYEQEYNVGVYAIDFAWPHKKLAIEIDGAQHERFEEYRLRDARKDKYLEGKGWTILRIRWKDMMNETKKMIQLAKCFVDD